MASKKGTRFCPKCGKMHGECTSTGGTAKCRRICPEALNPTPDTFAKRQVAGTHINTGSKVFVWDGGAWGNGDGHWENKK